MTVTSVEGHYSRAREEIFFFFFFPRDGEGNARYASERGWNMRCGQLIYLRGRPDIRFVELRFKSGP